MAAMGRGQPKEADTETDRVDRDLRDDRDDLAHDLPGFARQLCRELQQKRPQKHDQIHDHELAPLIRKKWWTQLGRLLKAHEEYPHGLPDDAWISLRLDGCCWGTLMSRLKSSGVLNYGFREEIAETMVASCRAVMCEFGGVVGYTHSDEMTILVPPGPRLFDGRLSSWISLAASIATATCNRVLVNLAAKKGLVLEDTIVAHFDCRAGIFPSAFEAESLLLWRASDCNVNSASDAIKFSDAPMEVRGLNTIQKLIYLQGRGGLPLQRHQAYGSLLVRTETSEGSRVVLLNSGADSQPMHILNLFRKRSLIPERYLNGSSLQESGDVPEVKGDHEPPVSWPCTVPRCH